MKLLLIYNANSGALDRLLDNVHKVMSPSTYDCNLCAITFGNFTEDTLWKSFREHTNNDLWFYHKDEFEKAFKSKWLPNYDFPVILSEENQELQLFLSKDELNKLNSSEELIEEIQKRS